VLLLAGDDPSAKSSTLPCASERSLANFGMPVLYPANSDEVVRFGLLGIAMSRASGLWVGMKIISDVADGLWSARGNYSDLAIDLPEIEWDGRPWRHIQAHAATLPWSRDAEAEMVGPRSAMIQAFAEANPFDKVVVDSPQARFGILAPGKTFGDVMEALADLGLDAEAAKRAGIRIIRLGLIYPIAAAGLRGFAQGLETILVIEEKRAFVESQIREELYGTAGLSIIGKKDAAGKPLVPGYGALDAAVIGNILRRALPMALPELAQVSARIGQLERHRTSWFCSGCPHNRSTAVLDGSLAGGGIGCHAMALRMPQNAGKMTGITQMGGEGTQWIGQAPYTSTGHIFQNLGDGTFFHSGQLAVQACVAAGVNITYKLLYNAAVAMTGGQAVDGALPIPALTDKLHSEGVAKIVVCSDEPRRYRKMAPLSPGTLLWHRDRLEEAQRLLRDTSGVTVLIYDQVCAAESRRMRKRKLAPERTQRVVIHPALCEGCGDCGSKSGCLSLQPVETEFGTKTAIDQGSCNHDYSCQLGECPSFMVAEPIAKGEWTITQPPAVPDAPVRRDREDVAILLAGIGGTGVVTVNQLLAQAAQLEGLFVAGLDQTGLSQKAGPVTSHLRIGIAPIATNRISTGAADLYLAFDALAGAELDLLTCLDPLRTTAIISTSRTPTGADIRSGKVASRDERDLIERITGQAFKVWTADAVAVSRRLFGSVAAANIMMLGMASQAGALPVAAGSIEAAIIANGVAVDANIAAFRWGRAIVNDPGLGGPSKDVVPVNLDYSLVAGRALEGETRRLAQIRAAALIEYQGKRLSGRYLDLVEAASIAERAITDRTAFSEAVARGAHRLMAYKDEYEVARVLCASDAEQHASEAIGPHRNLKFLLQPPILRNLGMRRKVAISARWRPALRMLAAGRRLRGTPFDLFGGAEVRRLERALVADFVARITEATERLSPASYEDAIALAEAAQLVRGYEHIKQANAELYRARVESLSESIRRGPANDQVP
jgi:indolepyruvate ferredoxin oxidoreductase